MKKSFVKICACTLIMLSGMSYANSTQDNNGFRLYFDQYVKSITSDNCTLVGDGNTDLKNLFGAGALSFSTNNPSDSSCTLTFIDKDDNTEQDTFTIYLNNSTHQIQSISNCSGYDGRVICDQSAITDNGSAINIAY